MDSRQACSSSSADSLGEYTVVLGNLDEQAVAGEVLECQVEVTVDRAGFVALAPAAENEDPVAHSGGSLLRHKIAGPLPKDQRPSPPCVTSLSRLFFSGYGQVRGQKSNFVSLIS